MKPCSKRSSQKAGVSGSRVAKAGIRPGVSLAAGFALPATGLALSTIPAVNKEMGDDHTGPNSQPEHQHALQQPIGALLLDQHFLNQRFVTHRSAVVMRRQHLMN